VIGGSGRGPGRTIRCGRRRGMIRFWDFKLSGAPPLLSVSFGRGEGMPHSFSASEQIAYSTARIECHLPDAQVSQGTGFFFRFREAGTRHVPCLVTNRHVLDGAVSGTIWFHVADEHGTLKPNHCYQMNIQGLEAQCMGHPDPNVDLAVLPVGGMLEQIQRDGLEPFLISIPRSMLPSEEDLNGFTAIEKVVMVGYPLGLWDERNQLPIFRRGITATHPSIDFNGRPEFMIDAACFPGSSGSPVFLWNLGSYTNRTDVLVVGSRVKFLGVLHAGPVHTVDGTIEVIDIPTRQEVLARSSIPTNLGIVLKSRLLADFDVAIDEEMRRTSPNGG
jgi:Trypsin-like peptidase domain